MRKRRWWERIFWRWLWRKWKRRVLSLEIDLSNERTKRREAEERFTALMTEYQRTMVLLHTAEIMRCGCADGRGKEHR